MSARTHTLRQSVSLAIIICTALSMVTSAQEAGAFKPYVGEVNADSKVNVRSGPSTNHYVVCQLEAGQRVTVVDQKFNWLAIEPPEGAGSLIKADDVDHQGVGKGIIKVDETLVYAAPTRTGVRPDDHHSHPKLAKGTEVQVLGTYEGGFLRIAPPPGARFWISGDYVQPIPAERLDREANPRVPKVISDAAPAPPSDTKGGTPATEGEKSAPPTESASSAAPATTDSTGTGSSTEPPRTIPMNYSTAPSSESSQPPGGYPTIISTAAGGTTIDPDTPAITPGTNRILEEIEAQANQPRPAAESDEPPPVVSSTPSGAATPSSGESINASTPIIEPQKPILPEGIKDKALLAQLEAADNALYAEMLKPLADRNLEPSRQQFSDLANQQTDVIVQAYSAKRVEQIDAMRSFITAVQKAGLHAQNIRQERQQWQEQRVAIPQSTYSPDGKPDFVIQGILRPSWIYDSPTGPIRYRLVDPETDTPRTLAYVQLAEGVQYDMSKFFGMVVGVRARERILLEGAVDSIPIYLADELVVLSDTYSGFTADSPQKP